MDQQGTPSARPPAGRRMGVDVGTVRVGVALSDPDGIMASPLTTLERDPRKGFDVKLAANLAHEHQVREVVVGLPLAMSGQWTESTRAAVSWARALQARLERKGWEEIQVRMLDERWTSTQSHRQLLEAGVSRRGHRDKVDQQAAVTILEAALLSLTRSGQAGLPVPSDPEQDPQDGTDHRTADDRAALPATEPSGRTA